MKVFVRGDATSALDVEACALVEDLRAHIEGRTGIPVGDQILEYAGKPLCNGCSLSEHGITADATLGLSLRLRGGVAMLQLIVKPRLQKDLWSLYWKESMETKTESLDSVKLALPAAATVAEVHKEIEKRLGWEPTAKLERLEGFKDAWDTALFQGRALAPDCSLAEQGIASGAEIITVRRRLIPEGWKIIKEGEEDEDDSSDEDW